MKSLPFLPILKTREKYLYVREVSFMYKILSVLSIIAWILVLYGFYLTYMYHLVILLPFGLIFLFIATYLCFSSVINMLYRNFSIPQHQSIVKEFWSKQVSPPTIDILLPICGENINVLRNTWEGVKILKDQGESINVYVLDDKDSIECHNLALEFGFNYLVRPNRGEMKKAGNLKYGLSQSNGKYFIIFDADFRPHADFIYELLPYMDDEKVGIVQSPQYFDTNRLIHKQSPLQYGAGNIQQYFYKIIQNSRGALGGSLCVGSNAIYRRVALESIGGTAQKEHSEDVWTGFKLLAKGWKVTYIPVILAKGTCPDNQYSFFKQQVRWCSGSMSLMTSKDFWTAKIPFKSRLPFMSGFMYYISNPLMLFLPFLNIFLLMNIDSIQEIWIGVYYIPSLIISLTLLYFYVYPKARIGTILAHLSATWAYTYILLSLLLGKKEEWQPSGNAGSLSPSYFILTIASTLYLITYLSLIYLCAYLGKIQFSYFSTLILFWIVVTVSIQVTYVVFQWLFLLKNSKLGSSNTQYDYGKNYDKTQFQYLMRVAHAGN